MKTKLIIRSVDDALAHVESLLAAANGDESRCGTFSSLGVEEFTPEQRKAVAIYVRSWIETPLRTAVALLQEESDWSLEHYASQLDRHSEFGKRLSIALAEGGHSVKAILRGI